MNYYINGGFEGISVTVPYRDSNPGLLIDNHIKVQVIVLEFVVMNSHIEHCTLINSYSVRTQQSIILPARVYSWLPV